MNRLIFLTFLIFFVVSLPYDDQMTLTNSLIVGRDDASDLFNWTCKVCDASNKPVHAHIIQEKAVDIKCIVSVYSKFVILAFRYTNTVQNVWQDILYPLQIPDEHTCPNCKVQKAYNNMWQKIKLDVFKDLRQIRLQTKLNLLYITGISLGGGLAVISYIDISHQNIFPEIKVTTYGAPRVGNRNWADHFDAITGGKTRRYEVQGDPVVILPSCLTLLCNYKQTGIRIVCVEAQKVCKQQAPYDPTGRIKHLINDGLHPREGHSIQGIMDHVDGYPKIYNFTLITK